MIPKENIRLVYRKSINSNFKEFFIFFKQSCKTNLLFIILLTFEYNRLKRVSTFDALTELITFWSSLEVEDVWNLLLIDILFFENL
jgi:hypothetical protein